MARLSANMNVIHKACEKASFQMYKDFEEIGHLLSRSEESVQRFIANSYKYIGGAALNVLIASRPKYSLICENGETKVGSDSSHKWIIKLIDGYDNFKKNIGNFALCIALEENSSIIASAVFNPISGEIFWAEKGYGAFLTQTGQRNSTKRMRVSNNNELHKVTAITTAIKNNQKYLNSFVPQIEAIQVNPAIALDIVNVASGRYDLFWNDNVNYIDIAAAGLIAQEAGALISDYKGNFNNLNKLDSIIVSNESIQKLVFKNIIA